jgi:hypothetical protein
MSNQEYLEFLAALKKMDEEYLASPEKARELLEDEGALVPQPAKATEAPAAH